MIFYLPEDQAYLENEKTPERRYFQLPSGGLVAAEVWQPDQMRVVQVISTDPQDFLHSDLQPGSILRLKPDL
ncbi:MAG TPA: YlzJ-like family protein [Syntrophomonadaceae bacterium]|nr:YlzJ-like family protein [Syntrophomonadaceae bacterium]